LSVMGMLLQLTRSSTNDAELLKTSNEERAL
jgi:hypothetical protein